MWQQSSDVSRAKHLRYIIFACFFGLAFIPTLFAYRIPASASQLIGYKDLAPQVKAEVLLSYHKPFTVSDINQYHFQFSIPMGQAALVSDCTQLVAKDFSQTDYSLGLHYQIAMLSFGSRAYLRILAIGDEEADLSYEQDMNLMLHWGKTNIGFEILDLWKVEQEYQLSLQRAWNHRLASSISLKLDEYEELSILLANRLRLGENMAFLSSWQNEPSQYAYGIEFDLGNITLRYSIRTHPQLDLSHATDLGFRW